MNSQQFSKIITPVYFRSRQFEFPKPAVLELTTNEMVRVTVHKGTEKERVVVDAPVTSVKRLRVFRGTLMRLYIDHQTYWIDVHTSELRQPSVERMQSSDAWMEYFRSKNVSVWDMSFRNIFLIVTSISLGFALVIRAAVWFM